MGTTCRLTHHILRAPQPEALARFYVDHFSMTVLSSSSARILLAGTLGRSVLLELVGPPPGAEGGPLEGDGYWKIGFTTADVDALRARLVAAGVPVTAPRQTPYGMQDGRATGFWGLGFTVDGEPLRDVPARDPDGYTLRFEPPQGG